MPRTRRPGHTLVDRSAGKVNLKWKVQVRPGSIGDHQVAAWLVVHQRQARRGDGGRPRCNSPAPRADRWACGREVVAPPPTTPRVAHRAPSAGCCGRGQQSGEVDRSSHTGSVVPVAPLPTSGEVFLDSRGPGRALRVSWHGEADLVVVSLWTGSTCSGAFRMPIEDVPRLIGLLGDVVDGATR